MENAAQTSTIVRQKRGMRCNRTLRAEVHPSKAPSAASLAKRRLAFLAKLDKAAMPDERAMLFWLDTAARYHTDPVRDVIVALKTVEFPAGDGASASALYVWEVAWSRGADCIKWQFIVWDVSGYGVRFLDCADRDEAMVLYNLPVERGIAAVPHAPGVYLRAERRNRQTSP